MKPLDRVQPLSIWLLNYVEDIGDITKYVSQTALAYLLFLPLYALGVCMCVYDHFTKEGS